MIIFLTLLKHAHQNPNIGKKTIMDKTNKDMHTCPPTPKTGKLQT